MNSLAVELEWSARGWKSRDIERKDMSEMLAARLASEERWMEKLSWFHNDPDLQAHMCEGRRRVREVINWTFEPKSE